MLGDFSRWPEAKQIRSIKQRKALAREAVAALVDAEVAALRALAPTNDADDEARDRAEAPARALFGPVEGGRAGPSLRGRRRTRHVPRPPRVPPGRDAGPGGILRAHRQNEANRPRPPPGRADPPSGHDPRSGRVTGRPAPDPEHGGADRVAGCSPEDRVESMRRAWYRVPRVGFRLGDCEVSRSPTRGSPFLRGDGSVRIESSPGQARWTNRFALARPRQNDRSSNRRRVVCQNGTLDPDGPAERFASVVTLSPIREAFARRAGWGSSGRHGRCE